jgi:hypothetical protein
MRTLPTHLVALVSTLGILAATPLSTHAESGKGDMKQIADEAFVYGFPMVMNYADVQ